MADKSPVSKSTSAARTTKELIEAAFRQQLARISHHVDRKRLPFVR